MNRVIFCFLFLVSCIFFPWFVSVPLGILVIVYTPYWYVAVVGGLVIDLAFGAPVPALFNFAFIYSSLCIILSLIALTLRQQMME